MTENIKPKKFVRVKVEYCGVCEYGGYCVKLARLLNDTTPSADVVCTRGRQGSFEVFIDDVQVYSKLQTMALPDFNEVVSTVQTVVDGGQVTQITNQQPINCVLS